MSTKKFEYNIKDLPMLKRDMALRLVYFFLFVALCVLQVATIILFANQFTAIHYVVSCFVCVSSLFFAILCIWYATIDVSSISAIKRTGHQVKSTVMLFGTGKNSWFKVYYVASKVFTVLMVAVALSSITYNILQYIYYKTFSLYIPAILLLLLVSFHSVFHIDSERRVQEYVQEYAEY